MKISQIIPVVAMLWIPWLAALCLFKLGFHMLAAEFTQLGTWSVLWEIRLTAVSMVVAYIDQCWGLKGFEEFEAPLVSVATRGIYTKLVRNFWVTLPEFTQSLASIKLLTAWKMYQNQQVWTSYFNTSGQSPQTRLTYRGGRPDLTHPMVHHHKNSDLALLVMKK